MPNSRILYAAFFLSGASSLIYQLTWARSFRLVFGYSVYSAAFVSSLFLLGLGTGAWLAGLWSDRKEASLERRKLVSAYAIAEIVIGAWALALAFLLPTFEGLIARGSAYVADSAGWQSLSAGSFLLRYGVAFFLVFPPAMLMGSTLTLLGRYIAGGESRAVGGIGILYAINTAGAAFGAFALDAFLAPFFGVSGAVTIAAAGSWAAALLASRLRDGSKEKQARGGVRPGGVSPRRALFPRGTRASRERLCGHGARDSLVSSPDLLFLGAEDRCFRSSSS